MLKVKNTRANSKMLTMAKKLLPKLDSRGYQGCYQRFFSDVLNTLRYSSSVKNNTKYTNKQPNLKQIT